MPNIKTIDTPEIIEIANQTRDFNHLKAKIESRFAETKRTLIDGVRKIWDAGYRLDDPDIVTNFKLETTAEGDQGITVLDGGVIQVQMKLASKTWDTTDPLIEKLKDSLGTHFRGLFDTVEVVSSIKDFKKFFEQIGECANEPDLVNFTSTGFSVKKKAMARLTTDSVTFAEVVKHKSGFLDKIGKVPSDIRSAARVHIDSYLEATLEPVVVCGNRTEEGASESP